MGVSVGDEVGDKVGLEVGEGEGVEVEDGEGLGVGFGEAVGFGKLKLCCCCGFGGTTWPVAAVWAPKILKLSPEGDGEDWASDAPSPGLNNENKNIIPKVLTKIKITHKDNVFWLSAKKSKNDLCLFE